MNIKKSKLFKQIKEELQEDICRFVESVDDIDSWCETCLDCPSNTLSDLITQIPENQWDDWYELIDEEIGKISKKMMDEMEE